MVYQLHKHSERMYALQGIFSSYASSKKKKKKRKISKANTDHEYPIARRLRK